MRSRRVIYPYRWHVIIRKGGYDPTGGEPLGGVPRKAGNQEACLSTFIYVRV